MGIFGKLRKIVQSSAETVDREAWANAVHEHTGEVWTGNPIEFGARVDLAHLAAQVPRNSVKHFWAAYYRGRVYELSGVENGLIKRGGCLGSVDLDDEIRADIRGVNVCLLRLAVEGRGKRQTIEGEAVFGRDYRYRPGAPWD